MHWFFHFESFFEVFFISIFSLIKVLQRLWMTIKDFHYRLVFLFTRETFIVCSLWYPLGCQSDNLRWTLVRYMWNWKLDLFAALTIVPYFVKTFIQCSGKLFSNWYLCKIYKAKEKLVFIKCLSIRSFYGVDTQNF